jgi:hypothetical protein
MAGEWQVQARPVVDGNRDDITTAPFYGIDKFSVFMDGLIYGDGKILHYRAGGGSIRRILACRATLIMSPCGDIRNVPFYRCYGIRNVP